jgi:hypothetical protein
MLTSWYWKIVYNSSLLKKQMDQHTYDNWVRIKVTFEKSGNTNNMFYKRACEIIRTGRDPLAKYLGDQKK